MFAEVIQHLDIKPDGVYIDCTFGRGGHSRGILQRLGAMGRLIAMDRDAEAVASVYAQELLHDPRFVLVRSPFSSLESIAAQHGVQGRVDGILLDLGVSSPQLDNADRGFSFLRDGPLDMRMDTESGLSAAQWLAEVDESYLANVLFEYGEERFARRIAKAVVETRKIQPIVTTRQLAKLVEDAVPYKDKHKHPATRTFQAIRIEVNHELDELKTVLAQALTVLKLTGRLVVISFHSLEDRLVKRFIRDESGAKYNPGRLPVKERDIEKGLLRKTGKAVKAEQREITQNPRARSAVMRVAEKV